MRSKWSQKVIRIVIKNRDAFWTVFGSFGTRFGRQNGGQRSNFSSLLHLTSPQKIDVASNTRKKRLRVEKVLRFETPRPHESSASLRKYIGFVKIELFAQGCVLELFRTEKVTKMSPKSPQNGQKVGSAKGAPKRYRKGTEKRPKSEARTLSSIW